MLAEGVDSTLADDDNLERELEEFAATCLYHGFETCKRVIEQLLADEGPDALTLERIRALQPVPVEVLIEDG